MRALLLCCFLLSLPLGVLRAEEPKSMTLHSRETVAPLKFTLSDSDWRWLGEKRLVNIAIYQPATPPFNISPDEQTYEGISADYVLLVMRYLGVRFQILNYASRDAALDAVRQGKVDMLVDDGTGQITAPQGLAYSQPFIPDRPVLVSRQADITAPVTLSKGARIAVAENCQCEAWVKQRYPGTRVTVFPTAPNGMSSVAFGENDYYIGGFTLSSFLIERNFINTLSIVDILPDRSNGARFIFKQDNSVLMRAVNTVLGALTPVEHKVIFRHWSQGPNLWLFESTLPLSERETQWLAQNKDLRVVINPLDAPFTQLNARQEFQGIAADVLRLIHLRTGLNFTAVTADNMPDMLGAVAKHRASLFAAVSFSQDRDKQLLLTRPYVQPEFVLVVKESPAAPANISGAKTVAITPDNVLRGQLEKQYPQVRFIDAKSASVAMKMVADGKADGAVHNLIGARYMIENVFPGQLKIAARVADKPALIGFAVGRDSPELYSILNKALADIPPRDISLIVNKWQTTPNVKLNTWSEYRHEFYWLAAIFSALVLTSLVWVYYLQRANRSRKEAQARLQEQATFLATLFNGTAVPVYVIGRDGRIINSNAAFARFFDLMPGNLLQQPLSEDKHPLAAVWQQLEPGLDSPEGLAASPQRFLVNNGAEARAILHQAVAFRDKNQRIAGLICSWQDMTEHDRLLMETSCSREQAEQANRSKSTFLATMSHEIRTPIAAIIGLLELAVTSKGPRENEAEAVRVAYESAQSLLGLIGDILDMAKIESGKLELTPEWVRFDSLAAPIVRVFEGLARQKGLQLSCHVDPLHPDEIWIDPMRLRQILSNLVSNAIKFTPQGSVAVQVSCPADGGQGQLVFSVSDTGIGIPQPEQATIFDPYVQSEEGKKQSGTGLGLAICQQLVTMMGGTITLHSQAGKGTRIEVCVPVNYRDGEEVQAGENEAQASVLPPLNILTVDDHPANRLLLKQQLLRLGHRVTEAENGAQALELYQAGEFELVITDCSMPVMDGLELTHRLRAGPGSPLVILGLTANAQPEERKRCIAAGMDDCLFKPLRLPQLEAVLNRIPRQETSAQAEALELEILVDLPALRALASHDAELLRGLLKATYDENQRDAGRARQQLEQGDLEGLAQSLHRLAGSTRIVGANDVAEACHALEQRCAKEPEREAINAGFEDVTQKLSALNRAIARFIGIEAA
ncbi:transporter substrate-binding domain-containing protein [Enterobacter sp. Ap-1006]|uniref:ATP-binding protein n=1 Tax=Enterobacter sp. Ap-1006 TaxID=2608345 RepID=UPI00141E3474|nr:transporter substrate-binding domain-containing protein [Enterobacter sp. Ap-1006]NIF47410.1 transporter substrate-binding domain-containing protein [Enterobacter sp. Ap-1006]